MEPAIPSLSVALVNIVCIYYRDHSTVCFRVAIFSLSTLSILCHPKNRVLIMTQCSVLRFRKVKSEVKATKWGQNEGGLTPHTYSQLSISKRRSVMFGTIPKKCVCFGKLGEGGGKYVWLPYILCFQFFRMSASEKALIVWIIALNVFCTGCNNLHKYISPCVRRAESCLFFLCYSIIYWKITDHLCTIPNGEEERSLE